MCGEDQNESHPLHLLQEKGGALNPGMNLLIARSGVGKSAAMINFALETLLQGKHVLHFTAGMTSEKVHHYYQEIFADFQRLYPVSQMVSWDAIHHRLIVISYLEPNAMIGDLEKEIDTICQSAHLEPGLILVDGLDVDGETTHHLDKMKSVAVKSGTRILASLRIHRAKDGHLDLDGSVSMAKAHTDRIYFLEPAPSKDRINLELMSNEGPSLLPIYFCPHNFVFKNA
jgi:hypothetical protein